MSKRNFSKLRHAGKALDKKGGKPIEVKGGWSHIKREPVKTFTDEEKAAWLRSLGL